MKKKQKGLLSILVLVVFCITVSMAQIVGCKQESKHEEIKLIAATYVPSSYKDVFTPVENFVKYINEHGKGKVKVEFFHSGSLLKAKQLLPGLMQGTADMILTTDAYLVGTLPILGIMELPFLYKDSTSIYEKMKIGSPLFNLVNREMAKKNLFIVSSISLPRQQIWTKDKIVRKPADFKGLRIRGAGRIEARMLKALGAAPTSLPSAETYEALSRGTIDGVMCFAGTAFARGLQKAVKYVNTSPFGFYGAQYYMTLEKWNQLPSDVQKILIEAGKIFERQLVEFVIPYHEKEFWSDIRAAGVKDINPTAKELAVFKEAAKPVWEWWKKQVPPGVGEEAIKLATDK